MKVKIILVDDSKTVQILMKRVLESEGFIVVGCADDGSKGLELFRSSHPDITLMDVTMPNMSGKECLVQILKEDPTAKVIMLSGLCDPHIEQECLNLGAKSFISKSELTNLDGLKKKLIDTIKTLSLGPYAA